MKTMIIIIRSRIILCLAMAKLHNGVWPY